MPVALIVDRVGDVVLGFFATVGALAVFAGRAVVEAFRPPYDVAEILRHVYQFGLRSMPLIVTAGFAIGVVLSMHTRASLERFGAEAMIPAGLAIALIRETGPLTAGLLVAGRVGAGIGAEIGAMRVTEQIDALEASAVDAFKYLVVTRVVACMVAMPVLTTMMNFSGVIGGYVSEAASVRHALAAVLRALVHVHRVLRSHSGDVENHRLRLPDCDRGQLSGIHDGRRY